MISKLIGPFNHLSYQVSFSYLEFDCSTQNYTFIIHNSVEIKLWQLEDKIKHPRCPRQANFIFTLIVKIADVGDCLGQYLQSRNASDSSDHVVKIADRLGCLGCGVHTGRKNPRCRKIVMLTILRTSGNQA